MRSKPDSPHRRPKRRLIDAIGADEDYFAEPTLILEALNSGRPTARAVGRSLAIVAAVAIGASLAGRVRQRSRR